MALSPPVVSENTGDRHIPEVDMPATIVDTEVIKDTVRLACRAPSLYTSRPLRWGADGGKLRLFLDPSRVASISAKW